MFHIEGDSQKEDGEREDVVGRRGRAAWACRQTIHLSETNEKKNRSEAESEEHHHGDSNDQSRSVSGI